MHTYAGRRGRYGRYAVRAVRAVRAVQAVCHGYGRHRWYGGAGATDRYGAVRPGTGWYAVLAVQAVRHLACGTPRNVAKHAFPVKGQHLLRQVHHSQTARGTFSFPRVFYLEQAALFAEGG